MNNKYYIINSNKSKFCIDYLFYIIIFIFLIFFIFNFDNKENFEKDKDAKLFNKDELYKQCMLNNEFISKKNKELEKKINDQNRMYYLKNNYDKIDNINNELLNKYFKNTSFPKANLKNKTIINSEQDLLKIKDDLSKYKNIYKVGDIVTQRSSENISSDDICYKDYDMNKDDNIELKNKYTNCMVCSINSPENYKNTNSWKKTKTNIKDICLYNVDATDNSPIANLSRCKKICKV